MPTDGKFLLLFLKRGEEKNYQHFRRALKKQTDTQTFILAPILFFYKSLFFPIQTVCWTSMTELDIYPLFFFGGTDSFRLQLFFPVLQVLEFVRVVILVRVSRWQKWQRSGTIKEQPEHVSDERVEELPIDHLYVDVGYHLMLFTRLARLYIHTLHNNFFFFFF